MAVVIFETAKQEDFGISGLSEEQFAKELKDCVNYTYRLKKAVYTDSDDFKTLKAKLKAFERFVKMDVKTGDIVKNRSSGNSLNMVLEIDGPRHHVLLQKISGVRRQRGEPEPEKFVYSHSPYQAWVTMRNVTKLLHRAEDTELKSR